MKVKEIMTRDVVSIKPEESAKDALALLLKMQISGLPVIDESGKLVGMFTEKDILSHALPSYIENVGRFIYQENPKSVKRKFMELGNIKVSKLMRREVVTTTEDTALCEVAKIMLTKKARRLPVLDKSGKVVGIVARGDVLKAVANES
jgi:CBS-domain-containing membrane protein